MCSPFVIVVCESLNCPQCEKIDQNHIAIVAKGSNMQKMLENQEDFSWIIQVITHSNKIQGYVNF